MSFLGNLFKSDQSASDFVAEQIALNGSEHAVTEASKRGATEGDVDEGFKKHSEKSPCKKVPDRSRF